jgi:hypothetical protein
MARKRTSLSTTSVPGLGARFELRQPDGTTLAVRIVEGSTCIISFATDTGCNNLIEMTKHQALFLTEFLVAKVGLLK